MCQACPEMIAGAVKENLRLVLEPAKRARMNDASPVALKFGAISVAGLRKFSPPRVARFLGERRKDSPLVSFHFFSRLPALSGTLRATRIIRHSEDYPRSRPLCKISAVVRMRPCSKVKFVAATRTTLLSKQ